MRFTACAASVGVLLALGSCSTMKPAPPAKADTSGLSQPAAPADTPPEPAPQPESMPETGDNNAPTNNAGTAACGCPSTDTKPKIVAKTKPKPAPKPVPPAAADATAAEGPPASANSAQVRPVPVSVTTILGKRVQGPKGEDLGRVVDVLADASGRVRVAIIDFGGFLGVGDRRVAVEWPLLRFNVQSDQPIVLSVPFDQLKSVPEFKDAQRPQALMTPAVTAPAAIDAGAPVDNKK